MIIKPKIRGFICTTAHPIGCEASVAEQVTYVQSQGKIPGPKRVLVVGASTGYGLASRIVAAFGSDAKTIGVSYEKEPSEGRTASAGWYNTVAFEKLAKERNLYAKSLNGDAFSNDIKQQVAELIKNDLGQVDLVVYSLASPRRTDPKTGITYNSALKPIGQTFTSKTVDPFKGEVKEVTLEPASEEEIENTIKVMGGEDWAEWVNLLMGQGLLADGAKTIAYSYIGPVMTHPIYKDGTIGKAKEHLYKTAKELSAKLAEIKGSACVSVNKALVTQASAAIPVVPLYISLLYKIMKAKGTHEGCIEQMYRLFKDKIHSPQDALIYLDDYEMAEDVQQAINTLWPQVTTENLEALADVEGYRNDFYRLFGFNLAGVDYEADISI